MGHKERMAGKPATIPTLQKAIQKKVATALAPVVKPSKAA